MSNKNDNLSKDEILAVRTILISKKTGQLCNRLQLYAVMIAAAKELNARLLNPAFEEYSSFFEGTVHGNICFPENCHSQIPLLGRLTYRKARLFYRISRMVSIACSQRVKVLKARSRSYVDLELSDEDLRGSDWRWLVTQGLHFYADLWCQRHADSIRRFLSPVESIRLDAERSLVPARECGGIVLGVHIRGTDYQTFYGGQFYYSAAQYASCISPFVKALWPQKVSLLICSDEVVDLSAFSAFRVFVGPGTVVGDLHALSLCDYIVGPPSSYNAWASFYGAKPLYQLKSVDERPLPSDFLVCRAPGAMRMEEGIRPGQ